MYRIHPNQARRRAWRQTIGGPAASIAGAAGGVVARVAAVAPAVALAVVLAMVFASPLQAGQGSQAAERITKAMEYLGGDNPDPKRALEELDKAIDADPNNAGAYFYRGMAFGQLQDLPQSLASFITASELAPGYAEAHMRACMLAFGLQDFELAWDQAILASQTGIDMSQAFVELRAQSPEPDDFEQRMRAKRVFLGQIDVDAIANRDEIAPGDSLSSIASVSASSRGTGDDVASPFGSGGTTVLGEVQADLAEVRRMFGELLHESDDFVVVRQPELANYVLFLKVDDVDAGSPRPMKGFVKFFEQDAEVYSRPLQLRNISSKADLRTDLSRYVGFMEEWLTEQER